MIKIGLTGVIGSGKSTAANYFSKLGVPVFFADNSAKKIMNTDSSVKKCLVDLLGSLAYSNGELNKQFISDKIFNNQNLLKSINNLIHPKVQEDFNLWLTNQTSPYVIYEAALIFENSSEHLFDKIICIKTPLDIIYNRLKERGDYSKNRIDKILKNQLPQNVKCSKSDYCIENISMDSLVIEIDKIHSSLL
ncbi:MAG: dephospho-CoA kinase [Flavobacteriales bacterium]|nr:dephospho-CoA kinase [Flavobacteriales bacterium]|tara:strand:- start:4458 stop:5033 length:576 start_codon:yes stop_codon:yes gene_type:complete